MSLVVKSNFTQIRRAAIALLLMQPFVMGSEAFAQSIVPTQGSGNLGTQVAPDITNAQQLNITGGTQAAANLYHSFQQFGLTQGEIANFMSNPSIQNILARVSGGNASVINGLVQVTGGNSNLYLLNPAGIIFGANSSLNVPAAFTATTANGIQVGNGWFGVNTGIDDVKKLTGTPQAFGFASSTTMPTNEQPAAIVNAGNLTAKEGQSITLVGGLVINTGTITSPSGKITIAASADGKYVKITPEGSLLSLQLPIADQNQLAQSNVQAKDLPSLLTGSANLRNMTGLNTDASGNVLVAGIAIPNTAGTAIASGNLDVSSTTAKGGEINVLGDRVGLVSANLNASGAIGGGTVLIGGDLQGKGIVPNAQYTFVSKDSTILADALQSGNGGKVIAWADLATTFLGSISAKGGLVIGNGGFVEVSGKENLLFQGKVNTTALNGLAGTLLLDPANITISSAASSGGVAAQLLLGANPTIPSSFLAGTDINIQDSDLRGVAGNVVLQATNNITLDSSTTFNNTQATSITFQAGNDININVPNFGFDFGGGNTQSLSFIAGRDINVDTSLIDTDGFSSSFFFDSTVSPTLTLTAQNRNVNITGNFLIRNSPAEAGVTLNLNAPNGAVLVNNGFLRTGQVSMTTDSIINITAGQFRVTGTPINGAPTFNGAVQNTKYSIYTFSANANLASQGNVSLQFGNAAPIISGNGGNNLINIRLLNDSNFVVGKTPTTSGVDGQIGIGIASIPPQVFTLLSDQSFTSNTGLASTLAANTLNSDAIASARTADLQANAGEIKDCEPTGTKKPILNFTASLPSATVTRTAQNPNRSKLPPCKE
ncbi:filamentous hemagglutinin N-terminal domain-containing protein [Pseudanabaena sp. UWO311]|uniref:two-partner secretion domain-containing protein n=1 Tax=Pseudanabaena sp. UWO311 TaxID=2487337 RepID=UPI0011580E09|nr:filamentous hemagglutinin N-terminal domain-containing protein [Pseudanabaena sp. UWO311]TYQ25301.1 filamentous hemagglutinin N-terminal domain-containing protein [Pseudanabaena sp. UWO311]